MADESPSIAPAAAVGEGTVQVQGQAGGPASVSTPTPTGQPDVSAAPETGQVAAPAKPGMFKDLEHAERDYKALQSYSTRMAQTLSGLQPYGAPDAISRDLQALHRLRQDGEFQEWVKARSAKEQTGASDPDTVKALDLIDKIVESKISERLAPIKNENVAARMNSVFAQMDKAHPEWRGYMQTMHQRLMSGVERGRLTPEVLTDFDYDFVEDLYLGTAARDPQWVNKRHQDRLAEAKKIAIPSEPGTAPKSIGRPRVNSLGDAFKLAKESLGMA